MRTATAVYHEEPDGWWAESPEFPGFFAAGDSFEDTKARVKEALPEVAGTDQLALVHLLQTVEPTESAPTEAQRVETGFADLDSRFVPA